MSEWRLMSLVVFILWMLGVTGSLGSAPVLSGYTVPRHQLDTRYFTYGGLAISPVLQPMQAQLLYSFAVQNDTGSEVLVAIEPVSGNVSLVLDSALPFAQVLGSVAAFDPLSRQYAFFAAENSTGDPDADFGLYSVTLPPPQPGGAASASQPLRMPTAALGTDFCGFTGLRFNSVDGQLYSFATRNADDALWLVRIDPASGLVTPLGPLDNVRGAWPGSATLHAPHSRYAFLGQRSATAPLQIVIVDWSGADGSAVLPTRVITPIVTAEGAPDATGNGATNETAFVGLAFHPDADTAPDCSLLLTLSYNRALDEERLLALYIGPSAVDIAALGVVPLAALTGGTEVVANTAQLDPVRSEYVFQFPGGALGPPGIAVVQFGSRCPAGAYGDPGAAVCTPCAAGRYNPRTNRTSAWACQLAPEGAYVPSAGSAQPIACPPGTYCSGLGSVAPTLCPPGTFNPVNSSRSAAACLPCATADGSSGATVCIGANLDGALFAAVPSAGPFDGGNTVTLTGQRLGNGSDIHTVTLCGYRAAVLQQSSSAVVVVTPMGPPAGRCTVVVQSRSAGTTTAPALYRYNIPGVLLSAAPAQCPARGGQTVTLSGIALGDGSDIIAVLLQISTGRSYTALIRGQSDTAVVVTVPALAMAGPVDVTVQSVSFGTTRAAALLTLVPEITLVPFASDALTESGRTLRLAVQLWGAPPPDTLEALALNLTVVRGSNGDPVATVEPFRVQFCNGSNNSSNINNSSINNSNSSSSGCSALFSSDPLTPLAATTTVTVTALDDDVFRGSTFLIQLDSGPAIAQPAPNAVAALVALFSGLTASVQFPCVDNDQPGVMLLRGTLPAVAQLTDVGGFLLREGDNATLGLRLRSRPLGPLTLTLWSEAPARLAVGPAAIHVAPADWNVSVPLPVDAVDNLVIEGPQWARLYVRTAGAANAASDAFYGALPDTAAPILMLDNDLEAALQVSAAAGNVSERGERTALYLVVAAHIPAGATVNVRLAVEPSERVQLSLTSLGLNDSAYLQPLPVLIEAVDNRVDDDDVPVQVRVRITLQDAQTEHMLSRFWCLNDDVAGLNVTGNNLWVNETGVQDRFSVALTSQPVRDVTVRMVADRPALLHIEPASVTFTARTWDRPAVVTVRGLRDRVHEGDVRMAVAVTSNSSDPKYDSRRHSVAVTNADVYWPELEAVSPTVLPMLGRNATFTGRDFLPGMMVLVSGQPAVNLTWHSYNRLMLFTPTLNATLYQNVSLISPDGGYTLAVDALYYSFDCPFEGWYGRGLQCRPCFEGAICPGGNRVWPQPGWWTASEYSTEIWPCRPPSACLGGRFAACAPGYRGPFCSACWSDYYREGMECIACGSRAVLALLMSVQFIFTLALIAGTLFASNEALSSIAFVLIAFRQLWVVADDAMYVLPDSLQSVYGYVGLLVGDLSFIRPGCLGLSSFTSMFTLNVSASFGSFLPMLLGLYLQYRWRLARELARRARAPQPSLSQRALLGAVPAPGDDDAGVTGGEPTTAAAAAGIAAAVATAEKETAASAAVAQDARWVPLLREQIVRSERQRLKFRVVRGALVLTCYSYETLATYAFSAIHCVERQDAYVLDADNQLACFTAAHWPLMVVAGLILLCVSIGVPVMAAVMAGVVRARARERARERRWRRWLFGPVAHSVVKVATDEFRASVYQFGNMAMLFSDLSMAAIAVFMSELSNTVVALVRLSVLLVYIVCLCALRPFVLWAKNLGLLMVLCASLLTAAIPLFGVVLSDDPAATAARVTAYAVFGLILAFLLGLVLALLYGNWLHAHLGPLRGPVERVLHALERVFSTTDARRSEHEAVYDALQSKLAALASEQRLQDAAGTLTTEYDDRGPLLPLSVSPSKASIDGALLSDDASSSASAVHSPAGASPRWISPLHSDALPRLLLRRPDKDIPLPAAQSSPDELRALLRGMKPQRVAAEQDTLRPASPPPLSGPARWALRRHDSAGPPGISEDLPPGSSGGSGGAAGGGEYDAAGAVSDPDSIDSAEGQRFSRSLRERIRHLVLPPLETRRLADAVRRVVRDVRAKQRPQSPQSPAAIDERTRRALGLLWPAAAGTAVAQRRRLRPLVRSRPSTAGAAASLLPSPRPDPTRPLASCPSPPPPAPPALSRPHTAAPGTEGAPERLDRWLRGGDGAAQALRQAFPTIAAATAEPVMADASHRAAATAAPSVAVPGTLGDSVYGAVVQLRGQSPVLDAPLPPAPPPRFARLLGRVMAVQRARARARPPLSPSPSRRRADDNSSASPTMTRVATPGEASTDDRLPACVATVPEAALLPPITTPAETITGAVPTTPVVAQEPTVPAVQSSVHPDSPLHLSPLPPAARWPPPPGAVLQPRRRSLLRLSLEPVSSRQAVSGVIAAYAESGVPKVDAAPSSSAAVAPALPHSVSDA